MEIKSVHSFPSFNTNDTKEKETAFIFKEIYSTLIQLKNRKISRKRFKKLLMSSGVSRNEAEKCLNIIVKNKASYSWSWFMLNLGFGGNMQ